jgi:hypothetical protein
VLSDGGLLGTFGPYALPGTPEEQVADIERGDPFFTLPGTGAPWTAGALTNVGGQRARTSPGGRAGRLAQLALVRRPFPVTNAAVLGLNLDDDTGLAIAAFSCGRLAARGSPRPWIDDGNVPIRRVAQLFAQSPVDALEWYFPRRILADVKAVDGLVANDTTRRLGLRATRHRGIDVPLYALEARTFDGRALDAARELMSASRIPAARSRLVDWSSAAHLDPLATPPTRNRLLRTLTPFLRRTIRAELTEDGAFTGRAGVAAPSP